MKVCIHVDVPMAPCIHVYAIAKRVVRDQFQCAASI